MSSALQTLLERDAAAVFMLSPRGPLEVKGAGLMETFFLDAEGDPGSNLT